MNRSILSISGHTSFNSLLKTHLSEKYTFIPVTDAFHAVRQLKKRDEIELIIVDVDYNIEANLDFIQHINSSGFYQMPLIILSTNDDIKSKLMLPEGNSIDFVIKPFSPLKLLKIIDDCMSQSFFNA